MNNDWSILRLGYGLATFLRRVAGAVALALLMSAVAMSTSYADPPDDPIPPEQMIQMLGKGFDASWAQFPRRIENYSVQMVRDIAAAGFRHIRLRTDLPADDYLLGILDREVQDCLDNGLIPIIAYGASEAEENPDTTHRDQVVAWWRAVAEHFKDTSHRLMFNLFIELSDGLKEDYEKVNRWYELIVPAIRETNPTRILILPPVHLSDPYYLDKLRIPEEAFPYVLAEWHFYASGPSKTNPKKLWTTGTPAERKLVTDKIQVALDWQARTGVLTWVGAWMPGNYNKGNDYTVPEQVVFASFMVRELEKAGIPWAVNAVHKFYDDVGRQWIQSMLPVRDAMLDPWRIALYSGPRYGGKITRLEPGDYDASFLRDNGLVDSVASVMVPDRMRVTFYADSSFGQAVLVADTTMPCLTPDCAPLHFLSMRVETTAITGVSLRAGRQLPRSPVLRCFPNPFNGRVTVTVRLRSAGYARLSVYDVRGRPVRRLRDGLLGPGLHRFQWDGRDAQGRAVPSGVYLVVLQSPGEQAVTKVSLVR